MPKETKNAKETSSDLLRSINRKISIILNEEDESLNFDEIFTPEEIIPIVESFYTPSKRKLSKNLDIIQINKKDTSKKSKISNESEESKVRNPLFKRRIRTAIFDERSKGTKDTGKPQSAATVIMGNKKIRRDNEKNNTDKKLKITDNESKTWRKNSQKNRPTSQNFNRFALLQKLKFVKKPQSANTQASEDSDFDTKNLEYKNPTTVNKIAPKKDPNKKLIRTEIRIEGIPETVCFLCESKFLRDMNPQLLDSLPNIVSYLFENNPDELTKKNLRKIKRNENSGTIETQRGKTRNKAKRSVCKFVTNKLKHAKKPDKNPKKGKNTINFLKKIVELGKDDCEETEKKEKLCENLDIQDLLVDLFEENKQNVGKIEHHRRGFFTLSQDAAERCTTFNEIPQTYLSGDKNFPKIEENAAKTCNNAAFLDLDEFVFHENFDMEKESQIARCQVEDLTCSNEEIRRTSNEIASLCDTYINDAGVVEIVEENNAENDETPNDEVETLEKFLEKQRRLSPRFRENCESGSENVTPFHSNIDVGDDFVWNEEDFQNLSISSSDLLDESMVVIERILKDINSMNSDLALGNSLRNISSQFEDSEKFLSASIQNIEHVETSELNSESVGATQISGKISENITDNNGNNEDLDMKLCTSTLIYLKKPSDSYILSRESVPGHFEDVEIYKN